jgi:transposase
MQADWATVGCGADCLSVFIATLGWSRMAYAEFCDDECVEMRGEGAPARTIR